MIYAAKNIKSHDYEISEDKIGYKQLDSISTTTVYGYSTMFAYYKANEEGKISKQSLDQNKYIGITCGSFAYA